MTDIDDVIREVRRLDSEATDGGEVRYAHGYGFSSHPSQDGPATPNTEAICYMRTAAPMLAAEVERLRAENERMRAALQRLADGECGDFEQRGTVCQDVAEAALAKGGG